MQSRPTTSESSAWKNCLYRLVTYSDRDRADNIPSIGTVDANFIDLLRVLAKILHMSQDMTTRVLGNKVTEISAQTHIGDSTLVSSPFLNREALKQDEALAVEEVLLQFSKVGTQFRKDEVALHAWLARS